MSTILVIDDDGDSLFFVKEALTAAGHDVLEAQDGFAGLDLIIKENPQLVLCDRRMPVMSGAELIEEVRERHPDCTARFVFFTGLIDRRDWMAMARFSPDAYVGKPITAEKLVEVVDSLLRGEKKFSLVV